MGNAALAPIIDAYRSGHQTLLVSGRSLFDLDIDERGELRPLSDTLSRRAKEEFGMATLEFDLALGARWKWDCFSDDERKTFEAKIQNAEIPLRHGLSAGADHRSPPHERAFLLLAALLRSMQQGAEVPAVLVLCRFGEDLAPDSERGTGSDWVIQISETLQLLAANYHRRRHRMLLIVTGTPERMDRRVVNSLRPVHLPQPEREDKLQLITELRALPNYKGAGYEPGLDDSAVANLTARTPNHSLEEAFHGSSRTGKPITHSELIERKRADVIALSEGTLNLLDVDRVRGVRLVGRTIERPLSLLQKWAVDLKEANPNTPMNVLLVGSPSSGKTDLALLAAATCMLPAYAVLSPKGSLVGQTERQVRLLFRVFKELSPAFGFVDEITEAFPTERNSMNLDSGASSAVTAEMLNALSDSSRAGRTLLIATTNCPWRVGAAMASRFLFVPVLSAVEEDYPEILCGVASNLLPEIDWDPEEKCVVDAARTFHAKGASPRVMRSLISSKIATLGAVTSTQIVERAATACAPQDPRDRASAEYADLFAIRVCSDLEMLPWWGRISEYPLPGYLRGIVNDQDGTVDMERLNRRIKELEPNANV
jgi:hypothetical protein